MKKNIIDIIDSALFILNEDDFYQYGVIEKRYFNRKSLSDIGKEILVSRQAIFQVEKLAFKSIKNTIKTQESIVCFEGFIKNKLIVTFDELTTFLNQTIDQQEIPYFNLLFSIYKFGYLPTICDSQKKAWCQKKISFSKYYKNLNLDKSKIYKFDDFQDSTTLRSLLSVIPQVKIEKDSFHFQFSSKNNAYHILKQQLEPMKIKELAELVHPSVNPRNLSNAMRRDNRFKCVGTSGLWGLSTWDDLKFLPIKNLIKNYYTENKNATSKDVVNYVLSIRSNTKIQSIRTMFKTIRSPQKNIKTILLTCENCKKQFEKPESYFIRRVNITKHYIIKVKDVSFVTRNVG